MVFGLEDLIYVFLYLVELHYFINEGLGNLIKLSKVFSTIFVSQNFIDNILNPLAILTKTLQTTQIREFSLKLTEG